MFDIKVASLWMGIILGLSIITVIMMIYKKKGNIHPIIFKITNVISNACIAMIVVVLLSLPMAAYTITRMDWKESKDPTSIENIISLSTNNLTQGKIYGRRGYVDQTAYYQYMVTLSDGGMIANKVPADKTIVYYDNQNPRVEWYKKTRGWLFYIQEETFWKMYIPEGSIVEEYQIDLGE